MTNNSNILVCGDLHTKHHILDAVAQKVPHYDKTIFMGDYVDDWGVVPEASLNLLTSLLELKHRYPDKVVLLLGNHDLSEWLSGEFACSGYNKLTHSLVKPFFDKHEDEFDIAYSIGNTLFTHAGLTTGWVNDLKLSKKLKTAIGETNAERYTNILNTAKQLRNIDEDARHIFNTLSTAGPGRGGWHSPSPLWADFQELVAQSVPHINQVVGHTPVKRIADHLVTDGDGVKHRLIFCDTHSTYQNGENFGDNTLLELTGAFWRAIPLK